MFGHRDFGRITGRSQRRIKHANHPNDQSNDALFVKTHLGRTGGFPSADNAQ